MSAFVVSKRHIDALLTFANRAGRVKFYNMAGRALDASVIDDLTAAGNVLLEENTRAVNIRYAVSSKAPPYEFEFAAPPGHTAYGPVQIIKACQCYEYQACEDPQYDQTDAARIIRAIQSAAIRALPGYSAASWEL